MTGSGKTEIYLQAVAETLQRGRQAIVLVPEIALTPQTVRRFCPASRARSGWSIRGCRPASATTPGAAPAPGLLPVIVGPRSALFTPLPDLGLIVVDECHDESYYQSELPPTYHAAQAAQAYARFAGAVCLLGSATPDIVTSYQASQGGWRRLQLPARILAHRQAVEKQAQRLGIQPAGPALRRREQPAWSCPPSRWSTCARS